MILIFLRGYTKAGYGGYGAVVSALDSRSEYSEFDSHQRRCAIETKVLSSHLKAYAFFDTFKEGLATLAWNLFQDVAPFPAVRLLV